MTERRRRFLLVISLAIVAVAGGLFTAIQTPPSSQNLPVGVGQTQSSQLARETLETLEIKGRAPRTGYSREQFGGSWARAGNCDTRNLILQRDLIEVKLAEEGCKVASGTLQDSYSGKTISFTRGQGTSDDVQIDHVVAVSDAWQKGAQQLSTTERETFYNDPLNLVAVDGPTNTKKSDGDAATWLPPNKPYRCQYVARQVAVKAKYKLWMTQAEHDAIKRILEGCPGQQLPIVER